MPGVQRTGQRHGVDAGGRGQEWKRTEEIAEQDENSDGADHGNVALPVVACILTEDVAKSEAHGVVEEQFGDLLGRVIGDVLTTSYNVTTSIENNEGFIQPLRAFPNRARVRATIALDNPAGTQVPVYMLKYGILINTRLVAPADEPRSWADLVDPKSAPELVAQVERRRKHARDLDNGRTLGGGME